MEDEEEMNDESDTEISSDQKESQDIEQI